MAERKRHVTSHEASEPALNRSYAVFVRKTSSRPSTGAVSSNGVRGNSTSGSVDEARAIVVYVSTKPEKMTRRETVVPMRRLVTPKRIPMSRRP